MGSIWDDRLAEVWAPPGKAGSGVVIGTCGVLTARHVIDAVATGAQTGPVLARVIRRGSPPVWVPMRIAGEDPAWDLAVLHVDQEAPEAGAWVRPVSGSPVVVTVGGSSERDCELVGFPDDEVQRPCVGDVVGIAQVVGAERIDQNGGPQESGYPRSQRANGHDAARADEARAGLLC